MLEILITSELSPLASVAVVGKLFSMSRERSEALGISGFLIFDGRRFCRFMEGDAAAVAAEAESVCADERFSACTERFRRVVHAESRRFNRWHLGYALPADLDACMVAQGSDTLRHAESLEAFRRLLDRMTDFKP